MAAREDTVRAELEAWLDENWDPDIPLAEWWDRLGNSGYGAPTWPTEWFGKGYSGRDASIVRDVFTERKVAGPPAGLGMMLAGPTIIAHGTDEQKRRYLPGIVTGQVAWCQLFSEPGAGSDLASLQCRAVRDGDEWAVTGQKVWTSGGHTADMGMLIARTNPDVPKHKGITYFAIEMDQPGVDVRPLREMTGRALFNEVFLDGARVRGDAVIGGEGEGWSVANTTLANERVGLGGGGGAVGAPAGKKGGQLERRAGDVAERVGARSGTAQAMGARGFSMMKKLAQSTGRNGDPLIRQKLIGLYILEQVSKFNQLRTRAAIAAGNRPGPEVSTGKLQISRITRLSRDLGLDILGAAGMLHGKDAPADGMVQEMALFSPAVSIYGGSDEIQHNIIGERVLGLPKEPGSDKDVPFKDLKVGTQR